VDEDEPLNSWVAYEGALSRGELSVPIRLRIRIGPEGEVEFKPSPLPMTRAARQLSDLYAPSGWLTLDAKSKGGVRFCSEKVGVSRRQSFSGRARSTLRLGFYYSQARFTRTLPDARPRPAVQIKLRGFEAFPALKVSCPLGDVVMQGKYPAPKDGTITGEMWVTATTPPEDVAAWRAAVKALTEHLLSLMSFALSHQLRDPLQSTWFHDQWELVATNQTYSIRNAQHVLHPMHGVQGFFEAAVASHFTPPITAKNLNYALEWFAMDATYSEMRLTNVMTALENLIDSNLSPAEKIFLPAKRFKNARSDVRAAIRAALEPEAAKAGPDGEAALVQLSDALTSKVEDLNRRPLVDKLYRLADRWRVSLQGLPREEIAKAIAARNLIVHRGYYYEPDPDSPEQADLWEHVRIMREVMMRFVFTIIAFEGQYLVFRPRAMDAIFPPLPPSPARSDPLSAW
jgi:hypothetical protein